MRLHSVDYYSIDGRMWAAFWRFDENINPTYKFINLTDDQSEDLSNTVNKRAGNENGYVEARPTGWTYYAD